MSNLRRAGGDFERDAGRYYRLGVAGEKRGAVMGAGTETLESVEVWLAGRLPGLRAPFSFAEGDGPDEIEENRGWVPQVTTDGALEALLARNWPVGFWPLNGVIRAKVRATSQEHAATAHEALCRAAKAAIEAQG